MPLSPVLRSVAIPCTGLALALLLACGDSGEAPPPAATPPPAASPNAEPPAPPAPAPTAAPAAAPAPSAGTPEARAEAIARGKQQYQLYCASCHGATGAGDGPISAGLDPKPAHHNDGNYMNALSDAHLHKVIAEGGAAVGKSPMMAPWGGTLSDAQIDDVIAYIRSLAVPPYEPSPYPAGP